jgi:hypothetical protein
MYFGMFFCFKANAYVPSEGNVTGSYGLFLYKTNFNGSTELAPSPVLGDFGFVTNGDLTDKGSLEIALFHMNKIYYRNLHEMYLAEKTEVIHIMMGYRRWLSEQFSLGMGFYSAYSIGDYQILHSESNVDQQIDTSARDTVEYGLDFSAQQEVWSKDKESVYVDFRYSYSISNKENEKGDHYSLLLAYRHLIQEKNPQPSLPEVAPDQIIEPRNEIK